MNLRRAIVIAACLLPIAAGPAAAQAPWPQQPQQSAPAPWPGQQPAQTAAPTAAPSTAPWPAPQQQTAPSPWQQPPQQQRAEPACMQEFVKLRTEAQKRANAIQAAGKNKNKPSAKEACGLFNAFSAAEAKMIKYVVAHTVDCKVPPDVVDGMKKQHVQTNKIRGNVCRAAAAGPPRPAGPSLSDALSAPVPDSNNIKTGRGTFDTLSGNPLGR
jgi:hypothetical protein